MGSKAQQKWTGEVKMKNTEVTGKATATLAGRILANLKALGVDGEAPVLILGIIGGSIDFRVICSLDEFQSIAASCLTQTPNKPKRARRKD
jgi:hypothetical protein